MHMLVESVCGNGVDRIGCRQPGGISGQYKTSGDWEVMGGRKCEVLILGIAGYAMRG